LERPDAQIVFHYCPLGDGLRPELRELFDQLAVGPNADQFIRQDGMIQSGPDPSYQQIKSIETRCRKSA
jgi:hypothetical protein